MSTAARTKWYFRVYRAIRLSLRQSTHISPSSGSSARACAPSSAPGVCISARDDVAYGAVTSYTQTPLISSWIPVKQRQVTLQMTHYRTQTYINSFLSFCGCRFLLILLRYLRRLAQNFNESSRLYSANLWSMVFFVSIWHSIVNVLMLNRQRGGMSM